jgi:hypothetical protein
MPGRNDFEFWTATVTLAANPSPTLGLFGTFISVP